MPKYKVLMRKVVAVVNITAKSEDEALKKALGIEDWGMIFCVMNMELKVSK